MTIGLFHPIVIKIEYHTGTKLWWVFLLAGIAFAAIALFVDNVVVSSVLGVVGASCL